MNMHDLMEVRSWEGRKRKVINNAVIILRVKGRRISFIQNDKVYSIIHDILNAMTSQGSECGK
jgi:hypothetical protein